MFRLFQLLLLVVMLHSAVNAQEETNPYKDLKFNNIGEEVDSPRDYKEFAARFKKILAASPDFKNLVGEVYAKGKYDAPKHRVKLEINFADEQFIINAGSEGENEFGYFLLVNEPDEAKAIETEKALAKAIAVDMLLTGWGDAKRGGSVEAEYALLWHRENIYKGYVSVSHYKKDQQWVVQMEILVL